MPSQQKIQEALDREFGPGQLVLGVEKGRPCWPTKCWFEGPAVAAIAVSENPADRRERYPVPRYFVRGDHANLNRSTAAWLATAHEALQASAEATEAARLAAEHDSAGHGGRSVPTPGCPTCAEVARAAAVRAYLARWDVAGLLGDAEQVRRELLRAAEAIERELEYFRDRPRPSDQRHGREDPAMALAALVSDTVTQAVVNCRLGTLGLNAARVAMRGEEIEL